MSFLHVWSKTIDDRKGEKTYGSLDAVMILMLYITGLAFLAGGQMNSTIEHAAAEHGHPEAKPVGRKAA